METVTVSESLGLKSILYDGHDRSLSVGILRKTLVMETKTCRIWGSHRAGYEEFCLLGYNAVQSVKVNRLRRNI
jgi:hypothetical protein